MLNNLAAFLLLELVGSTEALPALLAGQPSGRIWPRSGDDGRLPVLIGVLAAISTVPMPWRLRGVIPALVFVWLIGLLTVDDAERDRHAAGPRLDNTRIEHLATVSDPLTEGERDVLRLAAGGARSAEISAQLRLVEGTVRNYLSTAMAKLGARNRTEAANLDRERGWL